MNIAATRAVVGMALLVALPALSLRAEGQPAVPAPAAKPAAKPPASPVVQLEEVVHPQSFWFADTVQLAGQRKASFYNAIYSRADKKDPASPFRDQVVHAEFLPDRQLGPGQVAERYRQYVEGKL
jgi:hypothetical protein